MDTSHLLHKAIIAKLKADNSVTQVFEDRIYDQPPKEPVTPWLRVGEILAVKERAEGAKLYECYVDIHVYTTEGKGLNWCRACCVPLIAALDEQPLDLSGATVVEVEHRSTRAFTDIDGVTAHGIVNFRALTEY
jgi:hypothetical protein